ncbi:hypothetical protein [Stenoxybacter acetivorans]|uniref:hypothetical protein n=1 Tax=Stenoxybacter acetivorans TaxID=422441 RepID=UPI000561CFE1|nr:hypothetical protein [Stenoxybacter acetivorans]
MGGFILLVVFCLYCLFIYQVQNILFKKFKNKMGIWKIPTTVLFWIVMFLLPVSDEIVGYWQFRKLCQDPNAHHMNWEKIKGKEVYSDDIGNHLTGFAIPIYNRRINFYDMETNEEYGFYNFYRAKGGFLVRHIISGSPPIVFGQNAECYANYPQSLYELNHVTSTLRLNK